MTISKTSFLGSSQANIARLKSMNAALADLQRQMATKKKYDTLAGFGGEATGVQRNRTEKSRIESYLSNLDTVTNRIKQMDTAMSGARNAVNQLVEGISTAVRDSSADVATLAKIARNALVFVRDLVNMQHDGRYLFAGSDTATQPFQDPSTLNTNFQNELADWMNGTITTPQLIANTDAFTSTDLGFSASLSSAGNVAVRIDDTAEMDYTVKADEDGFQDMIRALALMANLEAPGPGDIPTTAQLDDVMQHVLQVAREGIEKMDAANTRIGMNFNLIKQVRETHEQDVATLEGMIGQAEDADTTEVVTQLQMLQTQMQASYEITRIVGQLSLINFL